MSPRDPDSPHEADAIPAAPPPRLGARTLVITDPTLLVRRANEQLVLAREKTVVATVPIRDLRHVALHGPVTLTGAAMAGVLDAGVDVTLHRSSGLLRGVVTSASSGNVFLLLAQADAWRRTEVRLAIAQAIVAGKLAGQQQILQRQALDRGSEACAEAARRVAALAATVPGSTSADEARGIEGAAAAAYFGVFGEMLSAPWSFTRRMRRPPPDPVNALLSLGYVLATGEVLRALLHAGFDPRIGLLHGLRYGRQSLALDLVEEFRATMVDRFVLRTLNRGELAHGHFESQDDGSVRLDADGRRIFFERWERMLQEPAPSLWDESPDVDGTGALYIDRQIPGAAARRVDPSTPTWRRRIERQVQRLRNAIMNGEPYVPLTHIRRRRPAKGGKGPAGGNSPAPADGEAHSP